MPRNLTEEELEDEIRGLKVRAEIVTDKCVVTRAALTQSMLMAMLLDIVLLYQIFMHNEDRDKSDFMDGIDYAGSVLLCMGLVFVNMYVYELRAQLTRVERCVNKTKIESYLDRAVPEIAEAELAISLGEDVQKGARDYSDHINDYKKDCVGLTMIKSVALFTPGYVALVGAAILATEVPVYLAELDHERPEP